MQSKTLFNKMYLVMSPKGKEFFNNVSDESRQYILNSEWARGIFKEMLNQDKETLEKKLGLQLSDKEFAHIRRNIIKRLNS